MWNDASLSDKAQFVELRQKAIHGIEKIEKSNLTEEFKCAEVRLELTLSLKGFSGEVRSTYSKIGEEVEGKKGCAASTGSS